MSRFTIHDLAATIDARAASGGEASYTRKLLDKGSEHCAKKLGEEAVETVIAAVENDRDHLISESADLLFHLLVLLKSRGVKLEDVEAALAQRTSMSTPHSDFIIFGAASAGATPASSQARSSTS